MGAGFESFATAINLLFGFAALCTLIVGIVYFRDPKSYDEDIAALRRKLDEHEPTDPQYNQARQVYAVGVAEASSHSPSRSGASQLSGNDEGDTSDGGAD